MTDNSYQDFDISKKEKPIYFNVKTGFYIARTDRGPLVVQSVVMPVQGMVTAYGTWVDDSRFGKQFKAEKIFFKDPQAALEIIMGSGFLSGIKAAKAVELVKSLGPRLFEVLDACVDGTQVEWKGHNFPAEFVLLQVKGIGPVVSKQIIASWGEKRGDVRYAIVAVQAGLNMRQYRAAMHEIGGEKLADWILNNPYKLSQVSFFNWMTVDGIAQVEWKGKAKIEHNSVERLSAAVREVITRHSLEGHMAMPFERAMKEATILAEPTVNIWGTIEATAKEEGLYTFNSSGDMITTKQLFEIERKTAERIVLLKNAKTQMKIDADIDADAYSPYPLTPEQKTAVMMALTENVSVITGGPGTGKTTTINVILNIMDEYRITYTLCAPTGKAARRMKEATGRDAATLHREFHLGPDATMLMTDYLFLDEASMVSAEMGQQVFDLIGKGRRIVLIGDADQLPPVGAGEVLMQLLSTFHIPSVQLKFTHRFKGGIAQAAHDINSGIVPTTSESGDFVVEMVNPQSLFHKVTEAVKHFEQLGVPKDEILVVTPLNKGPMGRHTLNKAIQAEENPIALESSHEVTFEELASATRGLVEQKSDLSHAKGVPIPGTFFRIGDKVIQTKNNYEMGQDGVMNGQVGTIIAANTGMESTMFGSEDTFLVVDFEGEIVGVTETQAALLDLAYVLTIHKTQGSQFKAIVCIIPTTRPDFTLRQLIYTGVTRAAEYCKVLAEGNVIERYVTNETRLRRFSMLSGLIELFDKEEE